MSARALKDAIREHLWDVVDRHECIRSATLTGSFVESPSLDGVSDIDFVVVADQINAERFTRFQADFTDALQGVLREAGYDFFLNATLGPLKFNAPRLAVLHLMLYSTAAHIDHAVLSPFTCLDWQRSVVWRKRSLADVYPVFGLQPRHFLDARRSPRDYLRDLENGVVSYRELVCTDEGYTERKQSKPMTVRDRHEFAYHVMRFLMQNVLKLLRRSNAAFDNDRLTSEYFTRFCEGAERFGPLYHRLAGMKRALDFTYSLPELMIELEAFVASFESQFRRTFFETATRHLVFRHAPTRLNAGEGELTVFQGRTDAEPDEPDEKSWQGLVHAAAALDPRATYHSPLRRSARSLEWLGSRTKLPVPLCDPRLIEIDYGNLEGHTVAAGKALYPDLFSAWARGEDPVLPGGESGAQVAERALAFVRDRWSDAAGDSVTCTHNVVLRSLIGTTLGIPAREWHRLRVPHLAPIVFVRTKADGLFIDIPPEIERVLFASWANS